MEPVIEADYRYQAGSNRLRVRDPLTEGVPTFARRELIYNDAGRLFQLIEDGDLRAEYRYNDNGLRTQKTIHRDNGTTGTILYHYDPFGQFVSETTPTGTPIRDYLWHDNGEAKAQIDANGGVDNVIYLHSDHLLTTRLATDASQSVIWRWEGEAFGNTAPDDIGGVAINLRIPGQYFDRETGLHYNHFRYCDPAIGRYITSDPVGLLGGVNNYGYALQNSNRFIDRTGRFTLLAGATAGFIAGYGPAGVVVGVGFDLLGKRIFRSQYRKSG